MVKFFPEKWCVGKCLHPGTFYPRNLVKSLLLLGNGFSLFLLKIVP